MLPVLEGFYDEMLDEGGAPRAHARTLVDALAALGADALAAAGRRRDAIFMQQGITFDAADRTSSTPPTRSATARSRSTSYRASSRRPSGRRSSAAWRSASAR